MMQYHYVLLYFEPACDADSIERVRLDWHELVPVQ